MRHIFDRAEPDRQATSRAGSRLGSPHAIGVLNSTTSSAASRPAPTPSCANRAYLRRRGIQAVIPVKEDQKANRRRRGSSGGRPPAFDRDRYTERNTVERCFNKLKNSHAVATRYDKRERIYQGTIDVASIRIWLRDPVK
jgi:transposase